MASALRPALPGVVDEVIAAVQEAVPVYSGGPRPDRAQRRARGAGRVPELVEGGEPGRLPGRDVYVRFGRAERRNGRSLDALLAAYRAGARRAWRALADGGRPSGRRPASLYALAEAIFAFIDEISSASAEGHAFEESLVARELAARRRQLLEALLADPAAAGRGGRAAGGRRRVGDARASVARAGVRRARRRGCRPRRWSARWRGRFVGGGAGPGRAGAAGRAGACAARRARRARAGGGAGARADSARRAALALDIAGEGELVVASERLLDLVLRSDVALAADLAAGALAPLDALPAGQRERLLETLAAWLDAHGEARPAAERLHVHVQTVRYRLDRLREVLGDARWTTRSGGWSWRWRCGCGAAAAVAP